ncbi:MAG: cbb3-type cytochrome c oxidase subunit I [Planctomycetota bacterium]
MLQITNDGCTHYGTQQQFLRQHSCCLAPGTIMALFGGIYYWFPKMTGRRTNGPLGVIHWAGTLLCMNGIFMPMLIQGLAGVSRRLMDGGASYAHAQDVLWLNKVMSHSAFALAGFQVFFIVNIFYSMFAGKKCDANPWRATTLEWAAAPSPPVGHGNFHEIPTVHRGPYEYSVPGHDEDFTPQNKADSAS